MYIFELVWLHTSGHWESYTRSAQSVRKDAARTTSTMSYFSAPHVHQKQINPFSYSGSNHLLARIVEPRTLFNLFLYFPGSSPNTHLGSTQIFNANLPKNHHIRLCHQLVDVVCRASAIYKPSISHTLYSRNFYRSTFSRSQCAKFCHQNIGGH